MYFVKMNVFSVFSRILIYILKKMTSFIVEWKHHLTKESHYFLCHMDEKSFKCSEKFNF